MLRKYPRFIAHYQPKVCLGSGVIIGHEALLREQHDSVLVAPGAIFAGMDGSNLRGLLMETTQAVLRAAVDVVIRGASPNVSINIPPDMLIDSDVFALLKSLKLPQGSLTIEILEYAGPPVAQMRKACSELRACGYRIAIDDFGEGESNLIRLMALTPDEVKLDAKLLAYPVGRIILPTICRTIAETGALVCIEGVETEEDHGLAVGSGAAIAQGFFYGVPSPL
ncbi:MAG: putative cyclic-di-GMP phosphodiesterase YjcC [Chloroflexi bacterium]|nr:putative cyclic-di-GMP phosphodiesterase YjcC [Chloroflexota bacterium]